MGGYGNRNMYYQTGLPGWMRFGFSPGWMERSPTGMGPAADYFMNGQWPTPQAQAYWQAMQSGQAPYPMPGGPGAMPYGYGQPGGAVPGTGPFGPAMTEEEAQKQELEFLRNQTKILKDQMDGINSRIKELESKKKE